MHDSFLDIESFFLPKLDCKYMVCFEIRIGSFFDMLVHIGLVIRFALHARFLIFVPLYCVCSVFIPLLVSRW